MRENFLGKMYMKKVSFVIFLLAFISCCTFTKTSYSNTSESVITDGHSKEETTRGKRFFMGLLPVNSKSESCVSCHNIVPVDTLNWNPSAMEIALKYSANDFASFEQIVLAPSGKKMSEVHKNFEIESEDLRMVKNYLDGMVHDGYPHEKVNVIWLIGLISLIIVIFWALIELIFLRKIKIKMITVFILLGAFAWLINILYHEAAHLGRQEAYAPLQPIKFSHKVHAGTNQTDCLYCHSTAEYSKSAGIPSANVCINCHIIVREGTNSGKFEINKIHHAVDNNIPIEWTRVHNLPDHVFFSHAQHVGAGKLDCMECHGPVAEMNVLTQHSDLSMGWCLDCHRTKKVQFVENNYYTTFKEFHDQMSTGAIDSVTVEQIGGTDCMKCHY
ncbi:MAG: hypothetical protein HQ522_17850 [Bacteroidetes bacterium]|nr:hypothetical protein [Bacteroidota bacterium]